MPQTCKTPLAGGAAQEPNQNTDALIIAGFALAGYAVHRVEDGYLVCRWNFSRHCEDLRALVGFARQVGVHQS